MKTVENFVIHKDTSLPYKSFTFQKRLTLYGPFGLTMLPRLPFVITA